MQKPGNFPEQPNWHCDPVMNCADANLLIRDACLSKVIAECRGKLCYLATPYTKRVTDINGKYSEDLAKDIFARTAICAAKLASKGITAVSPIVMSQAMVDVAICCPLNPLDQDFWSKWCAPLLKQSDVVIVPNIHGWDESAGVWHECTAAMSTYRPVYLMGIG